MNVLVRASRIIKGIELTMSYSASIDTLSLNLARHVRASCNRCNALGESEKDNVVLAVAMGIDSKYPGNMKYQTDL